MNTLLMPIHCGITGFGSPAAEYQQLPLSLDELLVEHPSATFLGYASGHSMQGAGIFDGGRLRKRKIKHAKPVAEAVAA